MTPLQVAVLGILLNAKHFEWSVQGLGMLRLYIGKVGRIHIWDSRLQYPGVSKIHTHSWDLTSTIVSGFLKNTRYTNDPAWGRSWVKPANPTHLRQRIVCGFGSKPVEEPKPITLYPAVIELFKAGEAYTQKAQEIHQTDASDGTVTLMQRELDAQGEADVYWPIGTAWGDGTPRVATPEEVERTVARALEGYAGA